MYLSVQDALSLGDGQHTHFHTGMHNHLLFQHDSCPISIPVPTLNVTLHFSIYLATVFKESDIQNLLTFQVTNLMTIFRFEGRFKNSFKSDALCYIS
jgi:hypothetical protein